MQRMQITSADTCRADLDQDLVIPLNFRSRAVLNFLDAIALEDGCFHFFHGGSFLISLPPFELFFCSAELRSHGGAPVRS
ncbi:MAG: hypothetical protein IJ121_05780, partial [Eubacterium sp.]|nr:hypothetical protein [Eubacterium sp.]